MKPFLLALTCLLPCRSSKCENFEKVVTNFVNIFAPFESCLVNFIGLENPSRDTKSDIKRLLSWLSQSNSHAFLLDWFLQNDLLNFKLASHIKKSPERTYESSRTVSSRFTKCFLQVYPSECFEFDANLIYKSLSLTIVNGEMPDFILFLIMKNEILPLKTAFHYERYHRQIFGSLHSVTTTAIFLVYNLIFETSSQSGVQMIRDDLSIVCMHCDVFSKLQKISLINLSLMSFKSNWRRIHRQLNKVSILFSSRFDIEDIPKWDQSCSIRGVFKNRYDTPIKPIYCLLSSVEKNMNITFIQENWGSTKMKQTSTVHGKVYNGHLTSGPFIHTFIQRRNPVKKEWLHVGEEFKIMHYMVVVMHGNVTKDGNIIINSFDKTTWIFIISTFLGFVCAYAIIFIVQNTMLQRKPAQGEIQKALTKNLKWNVHKENPLFAAFFISFASFIEQGQFAVDKVCRRLNFNLIILIIIWLNMATVINNLYKCVMFSSLAIPKIPKIPTALTELMQENYTFASVTSNFLESWRGRNEVVSTFRYFAMSRLYTKSNLTQAQIYYLSFIANNVILVKASIAKVIRSHDFDGPRLETDDHLHGTYRKLP
ncbi:unnamed protein product, partial [Allacma fusca]